jgi:ankyrin repeat protein
MTFIPNNITTFALRLVLAGAAVLVPFAARADSYTDFIRALASDDAKAVSQLMARGVDPNSVNEKGEAALLFAAREGSTELVRALVRGKANVNVRNPQSGDTPIMLAALAGNLATVKVLREAGAQINHPGWTPLQYAAFNGHNAVIDYLVSSGADLGLTAPNGATPVMLAVLSNKADTVKLLINHGFDVDARNDKGQTALDIARAKGFTEIENILRNPGAASRRR